MGKTKATVDVLEIFREYENLRLERLALEKQVKDLENREYLLKTALIDAIPAGDIRSGVEHKVTSKKSVSYTKVVAELTGWLPKAKQLAVPAVVEQFTTVTESHSFKGL
jgi:hypothetical protein